MTQDVKIEAQNPDSPKMEHVTSEIVRELEVIRQTGSPLLSLSTEDLNFGTLTLGVPQIRFIKLNNRDKVFQSSIPKFT